MRSPEVTSNRKLLCSVLLPCELRLVSDVQLVVSHAVWPALEIELYGVRPILAPFTVKTADPLAPAFTCRPALSRAVSAETLALIDPIWAPIVSSACLDGISPAPLRDDTHVSDAHLLVSHAVLPAASLGESEVMPKCDPTTVRLLDAVDIRLLLRKLLTTLDPMLKASVPLPPLLPDVKLNRLVVACPRDARHFEDVSDSHLVCSLAVYPKRVDIVKDASPILQPLNVRNIEPVDAAFTRDNTLICFRSAETP